MGSDRPDQFLLPPIFRHLDSKDPRLPPRKEVGWLAAIRFAGLKFVVGSGRDDEFFLPIAVEVAEHKRESPVRVSQPSLVDRHYVLAARKLRLGIVGRKLRQSLRARRVCAAGQQTGGQYADHNADACPHCFKRLSSCSCSPVFIIFFVAWTRCWNSASSR